MDLRLAQSHKKRSGEPAAFFTGSKINTPQGKIRPYHASEIWTHDKPLAQFKVLVTMFQPHLVLLSLHGSESRFAKPFLQCILYSLSYCLLCSLSHFSPQSQHLSGLLPLQFFWQNQSRESLYLHDPELWCSFLYWTPRRLTQSLFI